MLRHFLKAALWKVSHSALRALQSPPEFGWSIGIYSGRPPFFSPTAGVTNPVLTRDDITDVPVSGVADPFVCRKGDGWYMFFEALNELSGKGEIAVAKSRDGKKWEYSGFVLRESCHLSYPYVFESAGEFYMIPETGQLREVRLYRADKFPDRWQHMATLLEGGRFVDTSIFRFHDTWWLLTDAGPNYLNPILRLYSATDLQGPWIEHPASPIAERDPDIARPGGRVVIVDGRPIRFAQRICSERTDERRIRAVSIEELTCSTYRERDLGDEAALGAGTEHWNSRGMHHVDAHQVDGKEWIAYVDGLPSASSESA
jgi:hypothetical protein